MPDLHIVSVSSGAPSALLMLLVQEQHENVIGLFADTQAEHPDNYRFLYDLQQSGSEILFCQQGGTPGQLQDEQNTLFTQFLAPCTRILKLEPIQNFVQTMQRLGYTVHMHIGYTVEDKSRVADTRDNWIANGVIPYFDLIETNLTRWHVLNELKARGFAVPESYSKHFPNANCIKDGGCVKGGKGYMLRMLTHYPHYYAKREKLEAKIRYRQYMKQRALGVRVADIRLYTYLRDQTRPSGRITLKTFRKQYEQAQQTAPQLKLFTLDADGDVCGAECGVSNPGIWQRSA